MEAVTAVHDLAEHELELLGEAARTADLYADLAAQLEQDGLMIETANTVKVHPALAHISEGS